MVAANAKGPASPPSAVSAAALLRELGVSHIVTVPDNTSAPLLAALESGPIPVVFATREGEAIALASGLWMGGSQPVVVIQNTGMLESGDGLRGTASRMGVPLLLLVTCRGFAKARRAGVEPDTVPTDREILVRNDLDSVAHMTEGTLRAWGVPFFTLSDPSDLSPVREAWLAAREQERPVAVLLDVSFS